MSTVKNYNTAGDKVSESRRRTNVWGDEFIEHYDTAGDKIGESRKETGFWGDKSIVHRDTGGNIVGRSVETSDFWGDKYTKHYDAGGNYIGYTSETEDFFGNKYDVHKDSLGNAVGRSDGTLFDDPKETDNVCSGSSSFSSFDVAGALPDFDTFLGLLAGAAVLIGFFKLTGMIFGNIGGVLAWITRGIGSVLTSIIRGTVIAYSTNGIVIFSILTTIVFMFSVVIGIILDEDSKSMWKGIYGGLSTAVCLSVAVNPNLNPFLWALKGMLGRPSLGIVGYVLFALFMLLPFIAVALWCCILEQFDDETISDIAIPVCFISVIIILVSTFLTLAKYSLFLSFVVTGAFVYAIRKIFPW